MKAKAVKTKLSFCIIILFLFMNIFPSTSTTVIEKHLLPLTQNNILYVGGNGPNNFTKIQDAIDNASNSDTVYVYNGTYVENLIVNKSINLIGEDKNKTIIDGSQATNVSYVVLIKDADSISIQEFTFGKGVFHGYIIKIDTNYNIITNNIIGPINDSLAIDICGNYNIITNNTINNYEGISVYSNHNIISGNTLVVNMYNALSIFGKYNFITENIIRSKYLCGIEIGGYGNNNITENIISNCSWAGISIYQANDNYIAYNVISSNEAYGIEISWTSINNTIEKNAIINNKCGIYVDECTSIYGNNISINEKGIVLGAPNTLITLNNIANNTIGIEATSNKNNLIFKNNFINNKVDARYRYKISDLLFGENDWNSNFWNNPHQDPVPIKGRIGFLIFRFIPWFPQYDEAPASKPHEIE
jgi:parallel beta-helix repeat protein